VFSPASTSSLCSKDDWGSAKRDGHLLRVDGLRGDCLPLDEEFAAGFKRARDRQELDAVPVRARQFEREDDPSVIGGGEGLALETLRELYLGPVVRVEFDVVREPTGRGPVGRDLLAVGLDVLFVDAFLARDLVVEVDVDDARRV